MLNGLFRVDTNKLTCQTCLLIADYTGWPIYDTFLIVLLSSWLFYDLNLLRLNPNPQKHVSSSCHIRGLGWTLTLLYKSKVNCQQILQTTQYQYYNGPPTSGFTQYDEAFIVLLGLFFHFHQVILNDCLHFFFFYYKYQIILLLIP